MIAKGQHTVLYAVLNWGLGHATRSIPIIEKFEDRGFNVILLSDGQALKVLEEAFPHLSLETLPTYKMRYDRTSMVYNMARYGIEVFKAIARERQRMRELVQKYQPVCIFSDNRYGCRHPKVSSILVTHQLSFPGLPLIYRLAPEWWVRFQARKFSEAWIPDFLLLHPILVVPWQKACRLEKQDILGP